MSLNWTLLDKLPFTKKPDKLKYDNLSRCPLTMSQVYQIDDKVFIYNTPSIQFDIKSFAI